MAAGEGDKRRIHSAIMASQGGQGLTRLQDDEYYKLAGQFARSDGDRCRSRSR